jgi:hypothetical protein
MTQDEPNPEDLLIHLSLPQKRQSQPDGSRDLLSFQAQITDNSERVKKNA